MLKIDEDYKTWGPDEEKQLANTEPILKITLKKPWSKKPSYWITLLKWGTPEHSSPTAVSKLTFFYVVRSWKWLRGAEIVKGHAVGDRLSTAAQINRVIDEYLYRQINDKGYVMKSAQYAHDFDHILNDLPSWPASHMASPSEKPKDSDPSFKEYQNKRKKKAYW